MENNDLNGQEILNREESVVEQKQVSTPLNESLSFNQNLTNEQKLEYLSKLIQDVEQNLKSNGISKILVKKDNNLKFYLYHLILNFVLHPVLIC